MVAGTPRVEEFIVMVFCLVPLAMKLVTVCVEEAGKITVEPGRISSVANVFPTAVGAIETEVNFTWFKFWLDALNEFLIVIVALSSIMVLPATAVSDPISTFELLMLTVALALASQIAG